MSTSLAPAVTTNHTPATYHQLGLYLPDYPHASTGKWTVLLHEPQLGLFISQQYRTPSVVHVLCLLHSVYTTHYQQPAPSQPASQLLSYCCAHIDMWWVLCLQEDTSWLDSWQLHPTLNGAKRSPQCRNAFLLSPDVSEFELSV